MNLHIILFLIFLLSSYMVLPQVYAETITIFGSEDAYVDEDAADENFGQENLLASGWTNTSELDKFGLKEAISYIKFDLTKIPKTDLLTTVTINLADLEIFTEKAYGDAEQFIIAVYLCQDDSWLENKITWNNRNCKTITEFPPTDIEYVNPSELPTKYDLNITKNVQESVISNNSEITFIVKMIPLQRIIIEEGDSKPEIMGSLVHFSSSETDKSGIVGPKMKVSYSTTSFTQSVPFDIIIASAFTLVGIIVNKRGSKIFGMIKKFIKG